MNPMPLLIGLWLAACVPQPTTKPPELPPAKPKAMEFIDIPEQVPA